MRLKFFTIPVHGDEVAEKALDQFPVSHRILSIDRQFEQEGLQSAQRFCVSWTQKLVVTDSKRPALFSHKAKIFGRKAAEPGRVSRAREGRESSLRLDILYRELCL